MRKSRTLEYPGWTCTDLAALSGILPSELDNVIIFGVRFQSPPLIKSVLHHCQGGDRIGILIVHLNAFFLLFHLSITRIAKYQAVL